MDIGLDLQKAYDDGYKKGWEEAEAYALHCGDETPITNADRIRAMTDDELAAFMFTANGCPMWVSDYSCKEDKGCRGAKGACWLDWLKQEAEGV